MPVDKFGHFVEVKNDSPRKHVNKSMGFLMDRDRNLNFQNKRIKNLGYPIEEKDAVSKGFLQTEMQKLQQEMITTLQTQIQKIYQELTLKLMSLDSKLNDEISALTVKLQTNLLKELDKMDDEIKTLIRKVSGLEYLQLEMLNNSNIHIK